jgi:hypothetical protein
MPVELEPPLLRGSLEAIEMFVEVGDPLIGIKAHRFFEI